MTSPTRTFAGAVAALVLCLIGGGSSPAQLSIDLGSDHIFCGTRPSPKGEFEVFLPVEVSGEGAGVAVSWSVSGPGDGDIVALASDTQVRAVFGRRGTYTVRGEVTDDTGVESIDEVEVTISPAALAVSPC